MLQARQVGRLPLRQPDHAASRVRPALRARLLGLCVIASRCDRQVGQRWGWRWDTDRGKAIAASRTLAQPCPTASALRLQITRHDGTLQRGDGRGRSPCPTHRLGTSSFLVDGPRLQGGQRAINAIALWLALRNAASSAEMQSGKLAASAFADGRTRKDWNSGYPG